MGFVLNDKTAVARALREVSAYLQLKGESAFRSRAYDIAADRIAGLTQDLGELVETGQLDALPGIGKNLADKITDLVQTGKLPFLEELRSEFPLRILELTKIPDIGPKKAAALWKQLQLGDIDSLEKACREGKLRTLRGFGEKTEQKILDGIELARRAKGRHRLGDALPIARVLLESVRSVPGVIRAELGGSVRRGSETVSDIDIVASSSQPETILDAFSKHDQVAHVLAKGDTKCSVRLWRDDLQADLRVVPDEDFATALHHFTGSKAHHIRLRGRAQDRDLKISEWGVHRGDEKLPVPDEEALYALLEMQYVPPELREDAGEVEAAIEMSLPRDLVQVNQIMGAVHSHSTWSDGKNTLEEMALAAQDLGLEYLTVTEHSQAAHYAGGLTIDSLKRQWDEIDQLNSRLKTLRLLKGIEVDIMEDGTLDYPDAILEKLDVVIGSIHVRHSLDEDAMTQRVLRAFDNPYLNILGHPTGRLINTREPYGLKMEVVLDKAAEKGVAVEVNGNPHRLDIKSDYVRLAIERGVKLVASVDAHSTRELGHINYAVAVARKGWARKQDILNTLPHTELIRVLRQMRG